MSCEWKGGGYLGKSMMGKIMLGVSDWALLAYQFQNSR